MCRGRQPEGRRSRWARRSATKPWWAPRSAPVRTPRRHIEARRLAPCGACSRLFAVHCSASSGSSSIAAARRGPALSPGYGPRRDAATSARWSTGARVTRGASCRTDESVQRSAPRAPCASMVPTDASRRASPVGALDWSPCAAASPRWHALALPRRTTRRRTPAARASLDRLRHHEPPDESASPQPLRWSSRPSRLGE